MNFDKKATELCLLEYDFKKSTLIHIIACVTLQE